MEFIYETNPQTYPEQLSPGIFVAQLELELGHQVISPQYPQQLRQQVFLQSRLWQHTTVLTTQSWFYKVHF